MGRQYYYFIASLPFIHYGKRPPLSCKEFLARSKEHLASGDYECIESLEFEGLKAKETSLLVISQWMAWETKLRNGLARLRASRRGVEVNAYVRPESSLALSVSSPPVERIGEASSVLAAEEAIHRARWDCLEGLGAGHYFDLSFLALYYLKLQLGEGMFTMNGEEGRRQMEAVIHAAHR